MALYFDLPVFKDVYQLILKIFDYTNHFPREYKFILGQDLKRDGINLVRSIYRKKITIETLTASKRQPINKFEEIIRFKKLSFILEETIL